MTSVNQHFFSSSDLLLQYTATKSGNISSVKDYIALMKPRVMSLVIFTGLVGLLLTDKPIHPLIAVCTIICIALGAGASATINMWYDRDIDGMMKRTANRPIVKGFIQPIEALCFGVILGFFSVFLMAICVNLLSAALLLFTIIYYLVIYTFWLKRIHIQNVVIGGVAGALPPIIGSAAVGGEITWVSICLFWIIFCWTPAHSWALALYSIDDYRNSNIPMLPIVKGFNYTKKATIFYTILTIIVSYTPISLGNYGILYFVTMTILGGVFLYYAYKLNNLDSNSLRNTSKNLFFYSIFYLFFICLALLTLSR